MKYKKDCKLVALRCARAVMFNLQASLIILPLLGKALLATGESNVTNAAGEDRTRLTGPMNINGELRAPTTDRSTDRFTLGVTCDGSKYGDSLVQSSCLQALNQISRDPTVTGFRPRAVGQLGNLPWRWISGEHRNIWRVVRSMLKSMI